MGIVREDPLYMAILIILCMLGVQSMEEYQANVNLHTLSHVMRHILCIQLSQEAWFELSPPACL